MCRRPVWLVTKGPVQCSIRLAKLPGKPEEDCAAGWGGGVYDGKVDYVPGTRDSESRTTTMRHNAIWNLCLTHDPSLGGLYRSINDFARGLEAPILSLDDGRQPRAELSAKDGAVRIPCGTGWFTRDCHAMPRRAADEAAAILATARLLVVHSLFRAHAPWAARWAREHGRRYWAVPHGCLDPWSLDHRRLAKDTWLTIHGRAFLAGAERVVFSTVRAAKKAEPWVPGDAAAVVHWPVDLPGLEDQDEQRRRFRQAIGIPEDVPLLLSIGRLHPVKRPVETLHRFCTADTLNAQLAMVCIDDAITKADLVRRIPATHRDRVHTVGPLGPAELAAAYFASDGFVSLSFQENFGYAAAEAMAYGLPVILSTGHDLASDMPHDSAGQLGCGWLLPDDTPQAASQAITEWAALAAGGNASQSRLKAIGKAGRAWAGEALSFQRFQAALEQLVDGGPSGGRSLSTMPT